MEEALMLSLQMSRLTSILKYLISPFWRGLICLLRCSSTPFLIRQVLKRNCQPYKVNMIWILKMQIISSNFSWRGPATWRVPLQNSLLEVPRLSRIFQRLKRSILYKNFKNTLISTSIQVSWLSAWFPTELLMIQKTRYCQFSLKLRRRKCQNLQTVNSSPLLPLAKMSLSRGSFNISLSMGSISYH